MNPKFNKQLMALGLLPVFSLGCASAHTYLSKTSPQKHSSSPVVEVERGVPYQSVVAFTNESNIVEEESTPEVAAELAEKTSEIQVVKFQPSSESDNTSTTEMPPDPDTLVPAPTVSGMTLQDLEALALQNNPSILQANAVASKASGIHYQVGVKPNPSIGYSAEEVGNDGAGGLHSVFVSQTFVRGDKLAWNRQVVGHDAESIRWQVEAQRERVQTDIRVQFYQALAAQKRLELAREFRVIMEKGVQISKDRVKAQVGTRPDVLQTEIQLNEVELVIQQAEFEYEAAWKRLAAIAGLPELASKPLVGDFSNGLGERSSEEIYQEMVAKSPLLSAAYAQVQSAQANVQRQSVQAIPNINTQFGVGRDNGSGDTFANVQFSMPIPYKNKNEGNISAAHAAYCEATQNVQRLKMLMRQNLADAMRDYQSAQARVDRYESSILPKAQETLQLVQEAQQAGEFDFLRVLTARRTYFDANLNYISSLSDLSAAEAKIDGLLLSGGLNNVITYDSGSGLRGQALSGQ